MASDAVPTAAHRDRKIVRTCERQSDEYVLRVEWPNDELWVAVIQRIERATRVVINRADGQRDRPAQRSPKLVDLTGP